MTYESFQKLPLDHRIKAGIELYAADYIRTNSRISVAWGFGSFVTAVSVVIAMFVFIQDQAGSIANHKVNEKIRLLEIEYDKKIKTFDESIKEVRQTVIQLNNSIERSDELNRISRDALADIEQNAESARRAIAEFERIDKAADLLNSLLVIKSSTTRTETAEDLRKLGDLLRGN